MKDEDDVDKINLVAQKASHFMMSNVWIFENLISTLKEEQMLDAVDSIGKEIFELGTRMQNTRLKAFAQLTLGELASQEHIEDKKRVKAGIEQLMSAHEMYQEDASILSSEEYS